MTLSNHTKGATTCISDKTYEPNTVQEQEITQMNQIIKELSDDSHLSKTEALEIMSLLINSIKTHLIEGKGVNLNELGTFTLHIDDNNHNINKGKVKVNFDVCYTLEQEVNEKMRYNRLQHV